MTPTNRKKTSFNTELNAPDDIKILQQDNLRPLPPLRLQPISEKSNVVAPSPDTSPPILRGGGGGTLSPQEHHLLGGQVKKVGDTAAESLRKVAASCSSQNDVDVTPADINRAHRRVVVHHNGGTSAYDQ
jgi:hypothetical protein